MYIDYAANLPYRVVEIAYLYKTATISLPGRHRSRYGEPKPSLAQLVRAPSLYLGGPWFESMRTDKQKTQIKISEFNFFYYFKYPNK